MALISNDMMHTMNKRIFEQPPVLVKVKKTWKERLLSWPWKPWVRHRHEYQNILKDGDVFLFGGSMIMNSLTAHNFRKETRGIPWQT